MRSYFVFAMLFALFAFSLGDVCMQKIDSGPCRAIHKRYAYSTKKHECVEFFYGGCKGNENNFKTKEACMKKCYWRT